MRKNNGAKKYMVGLDATILLVALGVIIISSFNMFETERGTLYVILGIILATGSILRLYKMLKSDQPTT